MPLPGVHIETLHNPAAYAPEQLEVACTVAGLLNRGRFLLLERPQR
jgi:Rad3-related DNA helicase